MCIIIAKKSGVDFPSKEILRNCWDNNSDGAGVMYTAKDNVVFKKGFMTYSDFSKFIDKLHRTVSKEESICYHFRIGTQGGNTAPNTHPFIISDKISELKKLNGKSDCCVMHNGIISEYSGGYNAKCKDSDTQLFIADFLYKCKLARSDFLLNEPMCHIIEKMAGSRLCFLSSDRAIKFLGSGWITDTETSLIYSNSSYMPVPKYVSYFGRRYSKSTFPDIDEEYFFPSYMPTFIEDSGVMPLSVGVYSYVCSTEKADKELIVTLDGQYGIDDSFNLYLEISEGEYELYIEDVLLYDADGNLVEFSDVKV